MCFSYKFIEMAASVAIILFFLKIILCAVLIRWFSHLPVVLEVTFTPGVLQNKKGRKCCTLG